MRIFISIVSAFAAFIIIVWFGSFNEGEPNYAFAITMAMIGGFAGWTLGWSKYQDWHGTADSSADQYKPFVPPPPVSEQTPYSDDSKKETTPVVVKEINTAHVGDVVSSTESVTTAIESESAKAPEKPKPAVTKEEPAKAPEKPKPVAKQPQTAPKKTEPKKQKTADAETANLISLSDVEKQLSISRKPLNKHIENLGIAKQKKGRYVYIQEADLEKLKKAIAKT